MTTQPLLTETQSKALHYTKTLDLVKKKVVYKKYETDIVVNHDHV